MTGKPFDDQFDEMLREALECDALPPDDLSERIMSRVAETPQEKAAPGKKYRFRWLAAAAACLAIAGAALPMVLRGQGVSDNASAPEAGLSASAMPGSTDGSADSSDIMNDRQDSETASALDRAIAAAEEVLGYQGYGLDVIAYTENAVQVALTDGSGEAAENDDVLDNAMVAAGFSYAEGWYTLTAEDGVS